MVNAGTLRAHSRSTLTRARVGQLGAERHDPSLAALDPAATESKASLLGNERPMALELP